MAPVNRQEARLSEILRLNRLCLDLTRKALDEKTPVSDDKLEALVKERSDIIKRLVDIESDLEKKNNDERDAPGEISGNAQVQGIVAELRGVIGDLIEADKKLKIKLESNLNQVKGELDRLGKGHRAIKAYTPYGKTGARYFSGRL